MTAAEHLARGEEILARLDNPDNPADLRTAAAAVLFSVAHLLAAVALELGVPPASATPRGGPDVVPTAP